MKRITLLITLLIIAIFPIMAQSPELGSDFNFLNSIFVSLTTMALATYTIVEVLKIKYKPKKSIVHILYALVSGLGLSLIGWILKLGFLSTIPIYSVLAYGLISSAIAAFGYDIISALRKVFEESQSEQLNS